jgi:ArsR family transcriptional regulator
LRINNLFMVTPAKKYTERQEQIATFANALGHPVRIAILELLASQSCCYHGDLSEELPIANSTLSQHLKVLKDAGLIQGEINPPKTKYCINKQNYAIASELFRSFFADSLDTEFSKEGVILCTC